MKRAAWILSIALLAPLAHADQPRQPVDADRMYQLTSQLRCLVCQNESLADSDASLAVDLRNVIRSHMEAGESDAQIKKFLVDRYGDFVIYRPPFNASTLALWLGPLLLVAGGLLVLWRGMRSGKAGSGAEDAGQAETMNKREESVK